MTGIASALGVVAFFNLAAMTCCAVLPPGPSICYGGRETPKLPPEQPSACHAVMGCAAHRKPGLIKEW
jgi:hypothetical protein